MFAYLNIERNLRRMRIVVCLRLLPSFGNAATVMINSYDNGWYSAAGSHITANSNIIVVQQKNYRNFFTFDLSGLSGSVQSATLTVFGGNGFYFNSASSAPYNV